MSFYGNGDNWSGSGRQPSWEQQAPPSRSGTDSAMSHQSFEGNAFAAQFEEIDRATDNLMKSGKWPPGSAGMAGRRESVPAAGRSFDYSSNDPRMGGGPSRHSSMSDYDGGRPGSAGLQGFYAGQRFPPRTGQSEAEQVLQAKRRMAAQRERELRNYHQEQQYNRSTQRTPHHMSQQMQQQPQSNDGAGVKTDRAMSPNTMSEEDRRELIARQHRALYGDNSSLYGADGTRQPQSSQDARVASAAGRGPSPLAFDPYAQAQAGADGAVQMPPRDRANSTTSPASNPPTQQSYSLLNEQSSRTSNSSPGGSPPLAPGQKGGVAPIGTRPAVQQAPGSAGGLNKRSTTPLTPSSLSYGFSSNDAQAQQQQQNVGGAGSGSSVPGGKDERSISATTSSSSNPALTAADKGGVSGLGGWGGSSGGVWGSGKNTLGVQASVWG